MSTNRPVGNRILVIADEAEEVKSPGGIVMPDNVSQQKPVWGKVVAVGQGVLTSSGTYVPLETHEGDRVSFFPFAGHEITLNGKVHRLITENDVLIIQE